MTLKPEINQKKAIKETAGKASLGFVLFGNQKEDAESKADNPLIRHQPEFIDCDCTNIENHF